MIVFDLQCARAHVFEAWFSSSDSYEEQRAQGLVACPMCGATEIDKALMAPNVGAKGNRGGTAVALNEPDKPTPEAIKAALAKMAAAQAEALKDSTWVGRRFAQQARAMYEGEVPQAVIHGQASAEEARALAEDGIAVAPLIVPVVAPDALN